MLNIALIAHDAKKELMTQFCIAYCGTLSKHSLCATGTTGKMVSEATGLNVVKFLCGYQGGDEQITISTPDEANATLATIDQALLNVTKQRADLGAYQNRFEIAAKGINVAAENTQASESRIRDTDMASAMVEYTKNNILAQAGTAMLAQANAQSQNVLALLQ